MSKDVKPASGCTGPSDCSPRRAPVALMTASAAMQADCAALKKLADAGYEIVVVQDDDFEAAARVLKTVRRKTLAQFNAVANAESEAS